MQDTLTGGIKAVLEIDNKEKIVFFAHPSLKAKAEKIMHGLKGMIKKN